MKSISRALAGALIMGGATFAVTAPSHATDIGYQGCTPGYWKNHTDRWDFGPGDITVTSSTLEKTIYHGSAPYAVGGWTMLEALQGGGGGGVEGAAKILARAATAAYLNAGSEGLGYPWRRLSVGLDGRPALVPTVNAAFASGDRATMLALAAVLDADNNLGCPMGGTSATN